MDYAQEFERVSIIGNESGSRVWKEIIPINEINSEHKTILLGLYEQSDEFLLKFRLAFYNLFAPNYFETIVDAGNLKVNFEKDQAKISYISSDLISKGYCPIILSPQHFTTYHLYEAFRQLEKPCSLCVVDSSFDFDTENRALDNENHLQKILLESPSYLRAIYHIGHQQYFVDPEHEALMDKLNYEMRRLGEVKSSIKEMEPDIRSSQFLSFDLNSLSYEAAQINVDMPNGLSGAEACTLMKYGGAAPDMNCLSLSGFDESHTQNTLSMLLAQMLWYYAEGRSKRKDENPQVDETAFIKYYTSIEKGSQEIIFFKSTNSNLWWMELINPEGKRSVLPCSYEDYKLASHGLMPDRWWNAYQRSNY